MSAAIKSDRWQRQESARLVQSEGLHEGWSIYQGRWPEPRWQAVHRDFDASYEGAEDGWVGNGLSASANTLDELIEEVRTVEAEHPHFTTTTKE